MRTAETSRPSFLAKPSAAFFGVPSASNAAERGGTEHLFFEVGLRSGDARHEEREASRRAERLDLAVREARRRERVLHEHGHLLGRTRDERCRQLLDADLDQERACHRATSFAADVGISGKPRASRCA
jgi:hypothetical protein